MEKKVTIKELFESGKTKEPSVRALRARAEEDILVFVETNGNVYLYDEEVSVIRALAARKCKRPGIRWRDISRAIKKSQYDKQKIVELLNQNRKHVDIVHEMANELSALLL